MRNHKVETPPEIATWPIPEDRCLFPGMAGVAVVMGDGREWILTHALTCKSLDPIRDKLFDFSVMAGRVFAKDVEAGAWVLLRTGYQLTLDEGVRLIVGADLEALKEAVFACLIGPELESVGYSQWVRSALLANGLRADDIAVEDLPHVLSQLVETGRAARLETFVSSVAARRIVQANAGNQS